MPCAICQDKSVKIPRSGSSTSPKRHTSRGHGRKRASRRQISGMPAGGRAAERPDAALGPDRCTQRQQRPQHGAQQPSAVERVEGAGYRPASEIDQRKSAAACAKASSRARFIAGPPAAASSSSSGSAATPSAAPRPAGRGARLCTGCRSRAALAGYPASCRAAAQTKGRKVRRGQWEPRAQQRDEPQLNRARLRDFHRTSTASRGCRRRQRAEQAGNSSAADLVPGSPEDPCSRCAVLPPAGTASTSAAADQKSRQIRTFLRIRRSMATPPFQKIM